MSDVAGKKKKDVAIEVGKSSGLFSSALKASGKRALKVLSKATRKSGALGLVVSAYLDKNLTRSQRKKQMMKSHGIRPLKRSKKA